METSGEKVELMTYLILDISLKRQLLKLYIKFGLDVL